MQKLKLLLTEVDTCTCYRCANGFVETYTCHISKDPKNKGCKVEPFYMRKWVTTNVKKEATHITLDNFLVYLVDEVEIDKEEYFKSRDYFHHNDEARLLN
mgnify:CR=1 FL=1